MASISKEFEIEMSDETLINVTVTVTGIHEPDYGADADGNRGIDTWIVDSFNYDADDEVSDELRSELDSRVEELVNGTEWDFESVLDQDEDDFDIF